MMSTTVSRHTWWRILGISVSGVLMSHCLQSNAAPYGTREVARWFRLDGSKEILMLLSELESRFNLLLTPGEFKDFCPNGLIVKGSSGDPQVTSVVTGVSLRAELINWAIAKGSNVIFVHHPNGFWFSDKEKRVLDTQYGEYMRMLLQNRILRKHPAYQSS